MSSSSSSSSFCYVEPPTPPPRRRPLSLRSLFTSPPPPPPPPPPPRARGIHIQFPPGHGHSQLGRKQRLVRLQQTISAAVLDAGMSSSPGNATHPEDGSAVHRTRDALFCGTYGQLMAALEGAGLSAVPCVGEGVSGCTRLGALFVARNDGSNGVRLRKITLWG